MRLYRVDPEIHFFETVRAFSDAFSLDSEDLIFTEKVIYDNYIEPMKLPCQIMVRDDYETGEPSEEAIDKMLLNLDDRHYRRMVAIGGGSVMDTAKALVIDDAYPFAHLLEKTEANTSTHQLINIPTTCGTGAEISAGGIYFIKSTGLKSSVVGAGVNYAVLIPELIEKLPFRIFFLSSMDALSHAVEAYLYADDIVNEFGLAIASSAIRMNLECHAELYTKGADARVPLCRKFLLSSCMGNMALTANGANLVHAMAYPPAEKFHMAHGESVYQFLLPVLRLYDRICPEHPRFRALKQIFSDCVRKAGFSGETDRVLSELEEMLQQIMHLRSMREVGMTTEDLESFTRNIIETKQRLLTKALMPVDAAMITEMYTERL